MNQILEQYLSKMLEYEECGCLEEALVLNGKLSELFEEDAEALEVILLERGKLEFRAHLDKDALFDFMRAYVLQKNADIYDLILEAYLTLNRKIFEEQYQKNLETLKNYPHYRAEHEPGEQNVFPVWQDEECLVYTDIQKREFGIAQRTKCDLPLKPQDRLLIANEMWMDQILSCEKACRQQEAFMDKDQPFILVWDEDFWMLFCQMYDLDELIDKKRCVFLVDEWGCETWFREDQVSMPQYSWHGGNKKYDIILRNLIEEQSLSYERDRELVQEYYNGRKEEIRGRIREGKPRILFWTSRFTTAIQYRNRDVMTAAQRIGCETELLIEKSGIHKISGKDVLKVLTSFKPDIIFSIDYFRKNQGDDIIPQEIVWITWIQDKLARSTGNEEIVRSLGERDIVITQNISDLQGKHWHMDYKDVLKAPLSVDSAIYKKYELTEEEKKQYACDVCYVANASDYRKASDEFKAHLPEEVRESFQTVIEVYSQLMEDETFFYGYENNLNALTYILKELKVFWPQQIIIETAEWLTIIFSYSRYKSLVVEWLLEAGYTNLKLYGNGWENNERFRPYAMGPIQNGEKLSKALQASKIALGVHLSLSLPGRVSEITASGGFCCVNNIPEADLANAREYFKENEELVYFYNQKDLIEKTGYYLSREEERQRVAEAGRQRFLQELTYERMLERLWKEMDRLLEKREA